MTAMQVFSVAGLLADSTRAAMCLALLDGRAWTVGELARHAGVAPSTASEHISRMVDGGLLVVERQGRHRYVSLADQRTAELIEDLAAFAPPDPRPQTSLRAANVAEAMARARTCYDHLAGKLGVRIADAMTESRLLERDAGFALTEPGMTWLNTKLDVDVTAMVGRRRPLARPCLDWTERRPHLGGAAGAAICAKFLAEKWVKRIGSQRAVAVTPAGEAALSELFDAA